MYHVVVWLDHSEAKVFYVQNDGCIETHVLSAGGHQKLHQKAGSLGSGHKPEDRHYYHDVAQVLKEAHEILIMGPGNAKTELVKYLAETEPQIRAQVLAVESSDHPTDGQIVAHARQFFKKADKMLPQT